MSKPDDTAGGFFSAWSRRKLAAKRTESATPQEAEPEQPPIVEAEPPAPDPALIDALPPFLAKGISAKLKNAALGKLWMASPNVRD